MTSDGNQGKLVEQKQKSKNALLGVGILLGSYLILYTINPQIVDVEIKLTCNYGIIVNSRATKRGFRCIDSNMEK